MMTQQIDLRMRELTLLSGQGDPAVSQRAQYFIHMPQVRSGAPREG